jgi:heptaprenyl diphosphate synthase
LTAPPGSFNRRTLALSGALCIFLSALEYLIPKPLPFMRIGLANLPLMLALDLFPLKTYALLVLVKIAGQGIITGSLFSYVFLFSLGGSLSSSALMYLLRRLTVSGRPFWRMSLAGIGAAAAFCSNAVQLALARFLVFGEGVRYLIPPFLAAALFSGFALGILCEIFIAKSRWYARLRGGPATADGGVDPALSVAAANPAAPAPDGGARGLAEPPVDGGPAAAVPADSNAGAALPASGPATADGGGFRQRRREAWDRLFHPGALCAAGLVMALCFLFNPSVVSRVFQFLVFWLLSWLSGKKQNPLAVFLVMFSITGFNLLAPYGRVLASWGPLSIGAGSLRTGIQRAVTLEGLFMLSSACIRPGLQFSGSFGVLLGDTFRVLGRIQALAGVPLSAGLRGHGKEAVIPFIDGILTALDRAEPAGGESPENRRPETGRRPPDTPLQGIPLLLLLILIGGVLPFTAGRIFPAVPF